MEPISVCGCPPPPPATLCRYQLPPWEVDAPWAGFVKQAAISHPLSLSQCRNDSSVKVALKSHGLALRSAALVVVCNQPLGWLSLRRAVMDLICAPLRGWGWGGGGVVNCDMSQKIQ